MNKPIYVYVTPFFPSPSSWRGAHGYDFVHALMRLGDYEVLVYKEGDGTDYEFAGIKVHTFKARRLPSNVFPMMFKRLNQQRFLEALLDSGIRVEDVAVCHANTANYGIYPLAIKSINKRCKAILQHHDLASFGLNLGMLRHCIFYNALQFHVLKKMHEAMDCHVFISGACKRSFLSAPDASWTVYEDYKRQMRGLRLFNCSPVSIKNGIILHNGVDTSVFRSINKRMSQESNVKDSFLIGCIGNFQPGKDQLTLLKALACLDDQRIKVIFVGSGETLAACRKYARSHHINAEFRAEVPHNELPVYYSKLDLFVLPSYFEGFGCVFLEARACGVPFITCSGQGMDDYIGVKDFDTWLFAPRDYEQLAARIKSFIKYRPSQQIVAEIDESKIIADFTKELCKFS